MTDVTTIAARARDLTGALAAFAALKRASQNLRELQLRRDKLQGELERLRPAARLLAAARARLPDVGPAPPGEADSALRALAALSVAFAKDPQAVVAGDFGATLKSVSRAVLSAEAHAQAAWRELSWPVRDEMKGELLDALARVPAWREVVLRIRGRQARLSELAGVSVVTEAQFEEFFHCAEERNSAWQELQGAGGIPETVIKFLHACTKSGVPLDALTPEITDWLRERGILQHFRVRL